MSLEKALSMMSEEEKSVALQNGASAFEKWIMKCCRASEPELRKFFRKILPRCGFTLIEDNYKSSCADKDPKYETVHNMLAIRGNPRVCLVAHSDCCYQHSAIKYEGGSVDEDTHYWMSGAGATKQSDIKDKRVPLKPKPAIKEVEVDGKIKRIIQDQKCEIQLGGDDRLGISINTWIAINTGYDLGLYFPTDEEIGLKSAGACEFQQLKDFDLLCQVDRGNKSDEIVLKIGGLLLCDYETSVRLLEIAYDMGKPRACVSGLGTDVYAIKKKNLCRNCINMTCGYHQSHGDNPSEYIDIEEANDTLKYVNAIVRDYYLNP